MKVEQGNEEVKALLKIVFKVNRQRLKFVMRRSELKIATLAKWLIYPLVCVIIKICKKHLVLKTNSNTNILNETTLITTLVSQFANSSLFFKSDKYLKIPQ